MKKLIIIALVAVAGASQAVTLYNNGGFITNPTGGFGGAALSALTAPNSTFGYGMQVAAGNAVADDFTATNNWTVSGFRLFSYQTGATAFTFTSVDWSIVAGNVNTGTVVASGVAAPSNGGFIAYRALNTAPLTNNRPIYALDVTGLNVNLTNGQSYWLRWSVGGSLASGPWQPAVTPDLPGGNAQQRVGLAGSFATLVEAGSQQNEELPFELYGAVPEPASMLALSAGIAAIVARRRRK